MRDDSPLTKLLMTFGLIAACCQAWSEESPAKKLSGWQRHFSRQAAEYTVVINQEKSIQAKLIPDAVLHWSQPVRGGADGAVFVWKNNDGPVAIGTFFIWPTPDGKLGVAHEFHSLSKSPLVATWNQHRWIPPANSIAWNVLADAPAPAESPERRLRQMREIARRFSAESYDKKERRWELRMLASPIYRYEIEQTKQLPVAEHDIVDGALFGFVEGTDLEIVLSIQAHRTTSSVAWEYALSRMSDFRLVAKLSDETIWDVNPLEYSDQNSRLAYYNSTVETRTEPENDK